jgi:hypothetical protein
MARRFAQTAEATYRPEGLVYELVIPLGAILSTQSKSSSPPKFDVERQKSNTRPGEAAPATV